MYCGKCGKKIPEGARFCPACGAQANRGAEAFTFENIHAGKVKPPVRTYTHEKSAMERLGECKSYFFGAVAGLILAMFFLGAQMYEVTFEFFTTHSERFTMFEEKGGLKTIFILLSLFAAAAMLLPIIMNKQWERWNLYPALVVPGLSLLILLATMASVKSQMADHWMMEAVDAKIAFTGNGWLFLLINLVVVALAVKTIRVLSEIQEDEENETLVQTKQTPYWCAQCDQEGPYEGACPRCGSLSKKHFKL